MLVTWTRFVVYYGSQKFSTIHVLHHILETITSPFILQHHVYELNLALVQFLSLEIV